MSNLLNEYEKANAILTKLSKSTNWILSHETKEIDIERLLGSFGKILEVNRVYVFKKYGIDNIDCHYKQEYEWTDGTVTVQIDNDFLMSLSCYDKSIVTIHELLKSNESFVEKIKNMPEDARVVLEEQGILSIALIPIFSPCVKESSRLWGFVGFDDCVNEREWSKLEINALYALGSIIRTVVYKKEKAEMEKRTYEKIVSKMKFVNSRIEKANEKIENNFNIKEATVY